MWSGTIHSVPVNRQAYIGRVNYTWWHEEIAAMSTAPKMAVSTNETDQRAEPVPIPVESATPTHEEIAQLAYDYWEARGRPLGSPEQDWFRAEQDILMDRLVWGRRPPHPLR